MRFFPPETHENLFLYLFVCLIAGLLKEYLRELPEPVFSNCLYQMLVDAMGVFLPDDPDGNAKLVFSILDCLPKANRVNMLPSLLLLLQVVEREHQNKTQLFDAVLHVYKLQNAS